MLRIQETVLTFHSSVDGCGTIADPQTVFSTTVIRSEADPVTRRRFPPDTRVYAKKRQARHCRGKLAPFIQGWIGWIDQKIEVFCNGDEWVEIIHSVQGRSAS
jgi:hypothetical protein